MAITLRFDGTCITREVVEYRRDGWPICPVCEDDELAAIQASMSGTPRPADVDICYRCGPVTVLASSSDVPTAQEELGQTKEST